MFKNYKLLTDVVSLIVYCPPEKSFLVTREASGELWIPSSTCEKKCWKLAAHKINFDLFGVDAGPQCVPLRVYKVWLPNHPQSSIFHVIYKVSVKSDVKKRTKNKTNSRNRIQWLTMVELERQRAHAMLRSPEVVIFALMSIGEKANELDIMKTESGHLVEICEDNLIVGTDVAGGAVVLTSPNYQLLQAANYGHDDQLRLYQEFVLMVYPAMFMSQNVFTQFMVELGWQRSQCISLFRSADVTGRGGLSFQEFMLWSAALEPHTTHGGVPAEIRCRYIFRYFDSNRDGKLEYVEFKELVGATRAARQLPGDALSLARDADLCLRQLGMQPNSQLPLADFLRGVGDLLLRGTSSLLRSPRSIAGYIMDLHARENDINQSNTPSASKVPATPTEVAVTTGSTFIDMARHSAAIAHRARPNAADHCLASYTVVLRRNQPVEIQRLSGFDEDAASSSTTRLISGPSRSYEMLNSTSLPSEALAAVHYFASSIEKPVQKRNSVSGTIQKPAWSWVSPAEETSLGSMLLKLAVAVLPICASEPRLLRIQSPVYILGDLHGNLTALLELERVLWPSEAGLWPRVLILGDYVDRGQFGTELVAWLFASKLQRPDAILLLRGNHETRDIQKMFTFYNECVAKYGEVEGVRIWNAINNVFDVLPLAAVVDDKVFCCHGGIPPPWVCPLITAIEKIPTPLPKPAEQSSLAWELLWNDPVRQGKITASLALELSANEGFAANAKRGTGHVFDSAALDRFLAANLLSHVVRAHEMYNHGFMCQMHGRLISVFSSSHYCGGKNDAGAVLIDAGKLRMIKVSVD
ncbi:uncharacterized protein LOC101741294 isoform X2 [Bombyx mori]|uniref:Serine/threonine-protein phosphatase n=1 Tax=Bombyx mori TaxID=7091 RepID=A0A8R2DLX5_BOMMO|nr:uncharacterized protein LOC101741294 isoform X2 [Bombyx mori]